MRNKNYELIVEKGNFYFQVVGENYRIPLTEPGKISQFKVTKLSLKPKS